jgi:hypothetical protein
MTGLGSDVKERTSPTIISGFENTQQIAASGTYSLVLRRMYPFFNLDLSILTQNKLQRTYISFNLCIAITNHGFLLFIDLLSSR